MAIDFQVINNRDWLTAKLTEEDYHPGKKDLPIAMQLETIDTDNDGRIRFDEYRRYRAKGATGHAIKSALGIWFAQGANKFSLPSGYSLYDNGNHHFDPNDDLLLNQNGEAQNAGEVIQQIAPDLVPVFEAGFNWGLLEWHTRTNSLETSAELLIMGRLIDGLQPAQASNKPAIDALLSWFEATTQNPQALPHEVRTAAKALFHALPKVQDSEAIRLLAALNHCSPSVWRLLLEDLDFCLEMPKTIAFALRNTSPQALSGLFEFLNSDSPLGLIISTAISRLEPLSSYHKVRKAFAGDLEEEIYSIAEKTIQQDGKRHPSETILAFETLKALLTRSSTHKGDNPISMRCLNPTLNFIREFRGVPDELPMTWLGSTPKIRALSRPPELETATALERRYVINANRHLAESAFQTLILVGGKEARDAIVSYLHEPLQTDFDARFEKDPAHVAYFLRVEGVKTLGILSGHQNLYWNGEKLKEINEIGRRLEAVFWGDADKQEALMDELASAGGSGDLHDRLIKNLGDRALTLSSNYATLHYLKNLYVQNPDPLQAPPPDANAMIDSWEKPLPLPENAKAFSDFLSAYRARPFTDASGADKTFGDVLDALGSRYASQIPFSVFLNGLNQTEIRDYQTNTEEAQTQAIRAIFQLKSWTSGLHGRFLTWWNALDFASIPPESAQEKQVLAAIDGLGVSGLSALTPGFLITAMTANNATIVQAAQASYEKLNFPQAALKTYFGTDHTLSPTVEKPLIQSGRQAWLSIFSFLRKFNLERRSYPRANPAAGVNPIDPEHWQQDMAIVSERQPDRYERHVKKLVKSNDSDTVSLLLEALVTPVELTKSDKPLRYLMPFWGRLVSREKLQMEIVRLLANENTGKASPIDFLKVLIKWSQRNRIDLIDAFIDAFDAYEPTHLTLPPSIKDRLLALSALQDPEARAKEEAAILSDIGAMIMAMPNPTGFLDQMISALYNVKRAEFIYQTLRNISPELLSETLELTVKDYKKLESLNEDVQAGRLSLDAYEQAKHDATVKIGLLELILSGTEPKRPFTLGEIFSAGFRLLRGSGALL